MCNLLGIRIVYSGIMDVTREMNNEVAGEVSRCFCRSCCEYGARSPVLEKHGGRAPQSGAPTLALDGDLSGEKSA